MYFLLARATSRIVWPGVAPMTSPSMRIFTFSVTAIPLPLGAADVAAKASGRLLHGRHGGQAERDLRVRLDPLLGGHLPRHVAAGVARLLRRLHRVVEGHGELGGPV